MKIHRSNLISALNLAIKTQSQHEKENLQYERDSALVAGWREVLAGLEQGEELEIQD